MQCKVENCEEVSRVRIRRLCDKHYAFARRRLKGRDWKETDEPDFFKDSSTRSYRGFDEYDIFKKREEEITDKLSKEFYDFLLRLGDVVREAYLKKSPLTK